MFSIEDEARLQATAGLSLLVNSRLVRWSAAKARFDRVTLKTFEGHVTKSLDAHFGRVMRWILFSAGAEFFLKGLCLVHNIEIRRANGKFVPNYPSNIRAWMWVVQQDPAAAGTFLTTDFDTMSRLVRIKNGTSFVIQLADAVTTDPAERAKVVAAFGLLTHTMRNRDAHAYVPNVRRSHFGLVEELFIPVLNVLARSLPGGAAQLTYWRETHAAFLKTLPSASV